MSDLSTGHLNDFTLLRYVAGELTASEQGEASRHLSVCRRCSSIELEIRRLDEELRALADSPEGAPDSAALPPGDPFRTRPPVVERRTRPGGAAALAAAAIPAAERAVLLSEELLDVTREPQAVAERLRDLPLDDAASRYSLLYALQECGRRIAEGPLRAMRLAEETLNRLRRERHPQDFEASDVERMVPRLVLRGHAHLLAGQACLWTREFDRSRSHLELAYRSLARGGAEEITLAMVELVEAQRRSFVDQGDEALILARRATATAEEFGLADLRARGLAAQGNAHFVLGRLEEAVSAFREALPIFESEGIGPIYIGVLNNLGATLVKAGRLAEARREFAKALRRLSRERDQTFVAYIRHGLADILFSSQHYREAAISLAQAARLYRDIGLYASALTAAVHEIESWARHGDLNRARHRLALFEDEVSRQDALDPTVASEIREALAGVRPDLERIAQAREAARGTLAASIGASA